MLDTDEAKNAADVVTDVTIIVITLWRIVRRTRSITWSCSAVSGSGFWFWKVLQDLTKMNVSSAPTPVSNHTYNTYSYLYWYLEEEIHLIPIPIPGKNNENNTAIPVSNHTYNTYFYLYWYLEETIHLITIPIPVSNHTNNTYTNNWNNPYIQNLEETIQMP